MAVRCRAKECVFSDVEGSRGLSVHACVTTEAAVLLLVERGMQQEVICAAFGKPMAADRVWREKVWPQAIMMCQI